MYIKLTKAANFSFIILGEQTCVLKQDHSGDIQGNEF